MASPLLDMCTPMFSRRDTHVPMIKRSRGVPKDPYIDDPHYFAIPTFGGFGFITPLFS
jgi:hypothetical protein